MRRLSSAPRVRGNTQFFNVIAMAPFLSGQEGRAEPATHAQWRGTVIGAAAGEQDAPDRITPATVGLPGDAPWSIFKRTLHGGRQQGVELVTIDNGEIQIDIVASRGMGVLEVRRGDTRLGWNSPVKEVVHPASIDLASRGGLGWLEGFNEFVVRCGLEYAGQPGRDKFTDNTGSEAEMDLSLHGRIGNLPASRVEVIVDRDPPHRIRVRGTVHERQFYGPQLELVAEVSTVPGTPVLQIADEVVNHGAYEQEFELIYHSNFGRSLLEEGATVHLPAKTVTPMNGHAAGGIDQYAMYRGPIAGFSEQVYLIEPYANDRQETMALLQDAAGQRGASIRWSTSELPLFTLWKNTAPEAAGYVTGLEPGTNFPFNRMIERKAGRLGKLQPRQSRQFVLTYQLHESTEEVEQVRRAIEAIQGSRKTHLAGEPPEVA